MKFIAIDLYGDGEDIRILKDTKKNREKVLEWDRSGGECMFSDFCAQNKIKIYEITDILKLSPV